MKLKNKLLTRLSVLAAFVLMPIVSQAEIPTDGLIFHFDASDLDSLSSGSAVTVWPNRGSLGGSLSVYDSPLGNVDYVAPLLEKDYPFMNNQHVVVFTRAGGDSAVMQFGDFDIPDLSAGVTIFAALTPGPEGAAAFAYLGKATEPTAGAGLGFEGGRVNQSGAGGPGIRFGSGAALAEGNDITVDGQAYVSTMQMAQGAHIEDAKLRINGFDIGLSFSINDPDDPYVFLQNDEANDFVLGGRVRNAGERVVGGQEYQGLLGEVLVYNRVLSLEEIEAVENYLIATYDIFVTAPPPPLTPEDRVQIAIEHLGLGTEFVHGLWIASPELGWIYGGYFPWIYHYVHGWFLTIED